MATCTSPLGTCLGPICRVRPAGPARVVRAGAVERNVVPSGVRAAAGNGHRALRGRRGARKHSAHRRQRRLAPAAAPASEFRHPPSNRARVSRAPGLTGPPPKGRWVDGAQPRASSLGSQGDIAERRATAFQRVMPISARCASRSRRAAAPASRRHCCACLSAAAGALARYHTAPVGQYEPTSISTTRPARVGIVSARVRGILRTSDGRWVSGL
jgi:hypothetical protein